ncbi:MAG: GNAT family N-acetyltransferase [Oscillospiraceae bacterium]|nr:GNAT family N-acetyltransferase [Oscillospiraceae bacterium]
MEYLIRKMAPAEYPQLNDFLYYAIYVPEGIAPPPYEIIRQPELQVYTQNFGQSAHDRALAAVVDQRIVGAVWVRIMEDYGHIDDETPSFAISLLPEYRAKGIGTALMQAMLAELQAAGYRRASLSVQKANYAERMYRRLGFRIIGETEEEYLMRYDFV